MDFRIEEPLASEPDRMGVGCCGEEGAVGRDGGLSGCC